ncbi:MAG: hypothetical protein ACJ71N_06145 [Terriglobales bacterium]|jgi:hypothetical protein
MHFKSCFVLIFLLTSFSVGYGQAAAPAAPSAPASAVHVLAPKPGEKLRANFVQVQYEMTNAASANGLPTFRLRLDARDAISTTDTSYTFTGLTPGPHSVSITLVDANGTPVSGTQSEIRFIVLPSAAAPSSTPPASQNPGSLTAFSLVPRAEAASLEMQSDLEDFISPLMLLLAGVIVGGVISALRTRNTGRASK